jgi:ABC-type branched-subunit amino acid transport system ATPase component/ABC-type branched-subunit amino acid transport system permease subunit
MLEARSRFDTLPVALAVLVLLLPLGFVLNDVLLLTLSMALAFALAALGVDFLLGYAGQPTMGQSAFIGIGAYASTLGMSRLELPFPLSVLLAVVVCALLAFAIGAAAVKLQRLGFAIVTFMFSYVVYVLLGGRLLIPVIGSTGGLAVPAARAFGFDLTSGRALFFLALGLLAASLLLCARFVRSRSGLALVTLKQSETVAEVLGIDVHAAKRRAFAVSAILAAFCGSVFAQAAGYLTAESFDPTMSVAIFGMAAIGGLGTLVGPIFGALFYRLIPEVARDLQEYQSILFAVLMLMALVVFRDGLYGMLERLIEPVTRRRLVPRSIADDPLPPPGRSKAIAGAEALLDVAGVSLAFGGVKALSDVSMRVYAGSTHALIGANGAGKTTLLNCLSGVLRPNAGDIRLAGRSLRGLRAHRLRRLGIARTFQNPALSPDLTLLQNAKLGLYASHAWSFWLDWCGGLVTGERERRMEAAAVEALALIGLPAERWRILARDASFGEQKLVDLARAVAGAHSLLLLDEPAAGLTGAEIEDMVRLLAHLRAERQLTIVLVSHHVHLVRDVADRVTVLDFGRVLVEGTPEEIVRDRRVIDAFFGELHSAA